MPFPGHLPCTVYHRRESASRATLCAGLCPYFFLSLQSERKPLSKCLARLRPICNWTIDLPLPLIRQIHHESGAWRKARHREGIVQNRLLLIAIVWLAERVSKGPMQEEHTRGFHLLGQFPH